MPICLPCHASDSLRLVLSRTGADRDCCRRLLRDAQLLLLPMLVCATPCGVLPFFPFLDIRHSHKVVRPLWKVDAAAESTVADHSSAIVATGSAASLLQVRLLCVFVCVYVVQWGSARLSPLALLPLHLRAQPADGGPADEAAVRAVFFAHYERGAPADYVQLKDVAVALKALDPACHQRMCYKVGTQVTCNEALAAVCGH